MNPFLSTEGFSRLLGLAGILTSALAATGSAEAGPRPCRIEVVEKGSGWPVPMGELRTLHQVRLVSDNAG
jgi:hypothetical protein